MNKKKESREFSLGKTEFLRSEISGREKVEKGGFLEKRPDFSLARVSERACDGSCFPNSSVFLQGWLYKERARRFWEMPKAVWFEKPGTVCGCVEREKEERGSRGQ